MGDHPPVVELSRVDSAVHQPTTTIATRVGFVSVVGSDHWSATHLQDRLPHRPSAASIGGCHASTLPILAKRTIDERVRIPIKVGRHFQLDDNVISFPQQIVYRQERIGASRLLLT